MFNQEDVDCIDLCFHACNTKTWTILKAGGMMCHVGTSPWRHLDQSGCSEHEEEAAHAVEHLL